MVALSFPFFKVKKISCLTAAVLDKIHLLLFFYLLLTSCTFSVIDLSLTTILPASWFADQIDQTLYDLLSVVFSRSGLVCSIKDHLPNRRSSTSNSYYFVVPLIQVSNQLNTPFILIRTRECKIWRSHCNQRNLLDFKCCLCQSDSCRCYNCSREIHFGFHKILEYSHAAFNFLEIKPVTVVEITKCFHFGKITSEWVGSIIIYSGS